MKHIVLGLLLIATGLRGCSPKNDEAEKGWIPSTRRIEGDTTLRAWHGVYTYYNELDELVRMDTYEGGKLMNSERFPPQAAVLDKEGRLIEYHYYDVNGFCSDNERFIDRYVYDEAGHLVEEQELDVNGKFQSGRYRVPIVRHVYDDAGRLVRTENLDAERKITEDILGLAIITYEYDVNGNRTRTSYRNRIGGLVGANFGAAVIEERYDDHNNLVERRLLRPDGKLAPLDFAGPPIEYLTYDTNNHCIQSIAYYDENSPIGMYKGEFDERGIEIKKTYFDGKDLTQAVDVAAYVRSDSFQVISKVVHDAEGNLISADSTVVLFEVPGWKWESAPNLVDFSEGGGQVSFNIRLDADGEIVSYTSSYLSAGWKFRRFCIDKLNHLKATPTGENKVMMGSVKFRKL